MISQCIEIVQLMLDLLRCTNGLGSYGVPGHNAQRRQRLECDSDHVRYEPDTKLAEQSVFNDNCVAFANAEYFPIWSEINGV